MSPASKSKSKDKKSGKELTKASGKLAGSAIGSGVPLSAYNPLHGSFHALDLQTSSSASSIPGNGRFRSIDENEPNGNFVGLGGEFDAISNNGSWSGESEEHTDKISNHSIRQESVPGTDNDKREKIRQRNERKHQRQKERRNLELREKCGGYLMSRKLEYLSQQLVAMGFSAERSTMALILNEGKVDQSVAWLIDEGAEEADRDIERINASGNLKIDISEELARIAELEIRFKCLRQEVEKAVVACEGDIDKAAETIKSQKQEPPAVPPKREETGVPPTPCINSVKHPLSSTNQYPAKAPPKSNSSTSMASRDEKDFNYTRTVAATLPVNSKPVVQAPQKRVPLQAEWTKSQQAVTPVGEKRWPVLVTNSHVTSPDASPKPRNAAEVRYDVTGGELRSTPQIGGVREPVTVMQRHSSKPFVVTSIATSSHSTMPSWHPVGGSDFASNGVVSQIPNSGSITSNNISPNQLYQQFMYQHQQQTLTANNSMDTMRHAKANGALSKPATSSALTPASSLGLFPGTIAPNTPPGSSNPVDWLNGFEMRQIDYANIDWSLNRNTLPLSPSVGGGSLWSTNGIGLSSSPSLIPKGHHIAESRNVIAVSPRPGSSNDAGMGATTTGVNMAAMNDWSTPFEENDIFNLPRQFASSQPMYDGHHHMGI